MTTGWMIAYALLVAAVVALALVVVGLLRRIIPLLDKGVGSADFGGLSVLDRVKQLDLVDDIGAAVVLPDSITETTVILLMESTCTPCRDLAVSLTRRHGKVMDLPVIAILDDSAAARAFPLPADVGILFGDRNRIIEVFATAATPFAFVLAPGGTVLERRVVGDLDDVRLLAQHQRGGERPRTRDVQRVM